MKDVYRYFFKAIVTNSTHAIVIALAVASIGGIFSSTATDMGTQVCKLESIKDGPIPSLFLFSGNTG